MFTHVNGELAARSGRPWPLSLAAPQAAATRPLRAKRLPSDFSANAPLLLAERWGLPAPCPGPFFISISSACPGLGYVTALLPGVTSVGARNPSEEQLGSRSVPEGDELR